MVAQDEPHHLEVRTADIKRLIVEGEILAIPEVEQSLQDVFLVVTGILGEVVLVVLDEIIQDNDTVPVRVVEVDDVGHPSV